MRLPQQSINLLPPLKWIHPQFAEWCQLMFAVPVPLDALNKLEKCEGIVCWRARIWFLMRSPKIVKALWTFRNAKKVGIKLIYSNIWPNPLKMHFALENRWGGHRWAVNAPKWPICVECPQIHSKMTNCFAKMIQLWIRQIHLPAQHAQWPDAEFEDWNEGNFRVYQIDQTLFFSIFI